MSDDATVQVAQPRITATRIPNFAVKAVRDARHVSFRLFGQGHAAYVRKLVYVYLSTWANPDGTEACPSRETIAKDCGLTVRGLSGVLGWLITHGLVKSEYKASDYGTNRYSVMLSAEALEAARLRIEQDEEQAAMRAKAEGSSQKCRAKAKAFWGSEDGKAAKARLATRNTKAHQEHCVPGNQEGQGSQSTRNLSVPGVPGTEGMGPGTQGMGPGTSAFPLPYIPNIPIERPSAETATASLPVKDAADAGKVKSTEADYRWIGMQLARNGWQATPQTERIARTYLKDGHSKEAIWQAIEATMSAMPEYERQPGLYLAQNLKGNMDLMLAGDAPRPVPRATSLAERNRKVIDEALARRQRRADGTCEGELPILQKSER